jgi:hypothetical protein
VFIILLRFDPDEPDERMPTEEEFSTFEDLLPFLSPFKTATKIMSTQKYPNLSFVQPLYRNLSKHCLAFARKGGDLEEMATEAHLKLSQYFKVVSDFCIVAEVLDPRNKGQDLDETELFRVMSKYLAEYYEHENNSVDVEKSQEELEMESMMSFKSSRRNDSGAHHELRTYLAIPPQKGYQCNPLLFWKGTVHSFPTLSKMAKDFLAICGSSVPCERVFSSSRRVVDDLRHNLSSDTVRKIMCLKFWLKLESSETLT